MKKNIFFLFFLFSFHEVFSQSIPCVAVDCKTTFQLPFTSIVLNSVPTSSTDSIKILQWKQIAGPTGTTIVTPGAITTNVTNFTISGTYVYALTATTTKNISGIGYDTVIVLPANKIPVAKIITSTNNITLPTNTVTLDGSSSIDSDGVISNYKWSTGDTTKIINPVFGAAGTYNYSLTVTDNNGASNIASTSIIVNPQVILPPTVIVTGTTNVVGTSDTLTAVAIDPNPGGNIKQYGWGKLSGVGTQTITGATSSKAIITGLQSGSYQFKVTCWNAAGLTAGYTMTFNVNQNTKTITKIVITYSDGSSIQLP